MASKIALAVARDVWLSVPPIMPNLSGLVPSLFSIAVPSCSASRAYSPASFPVYGLRQDFMERYAPDYWVSSLDQHPNERGHARIHSRLNRDHSAAAGTCDWVMRIL